MTGEQHADTVRRQPITIREQIVKVRRGDPLPEGWVYARHIYEVTDLLGTWDVILMQRGGST